MTKLYKLDGELIFDEPFLSLKEAVEKHKADLRGANLTDANLKGANLSKANLEGANLEEANINCVDLLRLIRFNINNNK